jgi:LysM repeat protein
MRIFAIFVTGFAVGCAMFEPQPTAVPPATQASADMMQERLARLSAQVEALQASHEQLRREISDVQAQLTAIRQIPTVSAQDVARLEQKIAAIETARARDREVLINEVAKMIADARGAAARPVAGGVEHIVKPGETLSAIASAHGVRVADIVRANNLASADDIKAGQKLVIPK